MDKNRIITRVNKSTCDALKKKPEDLIGKHCYEVVHGTNEPWPNCPAGKTFETKQTVTAEINDRKHRTAFARLPLHQFLTKKENLFNVYILQKTSLNERKLSKRLVQV